MDGAGCVKEKTVEIRAPSRAGVGSAEFLPRVKACACAVWGKVCDEERERTKRK